MCIGKTECLNDKMPDTQCTLLNSTPRNILMAFMSFDVKGKDAVQKK